METRNTIALSRLAFSRPAEILRLYQAAGSATAVMEHRHDIANVLPEASQKLASLLKDADNLLRRADEELAFCEKNAIRPIAFNDPDYPQRLRLCSDAPLLLYYKGNADLNHNRIVNIVGTRKATPYGLDVVRKFITELHQLCPDVIILSGLAYGIDIAAHRSALDVGYPTIAVLAHGLDELYPHQHLETARRMVQNGGLLTEYTTRTKADKMNFVRRNRIVAGMADACLLAESALKGGGLITARMALNYGREVFAVPGRIGDTYSEGCNQLIANQGAQILTTAADFVSRMGWTIDSSLAQARQNGIERQLFPTLTTEEQQVVNALQQQNDLHQNLLAQTTGIPSGKLTALLFGLEMKGLIRHLAGGTVHLIL